MSCRQQCYCCCLPTLPSDEDFWAGADANLGASRARATAGQGQSVALARNVMRQNVGQVRWRNSDPLQDVGSWHLQQAAAAHRPRLIPCPVNTLLLRPALQ